MLIWLNDQRQIDSTKMRLERDRIRPNLENLVDVIDTLDFGGNSATLRLNRVAGRWLTKAAVEDDCENILCILISDWILKSR